MLKNKLPREVYQKIKNTMPADLEERVLNVLKNHVGKPNRISRRELIKQVFGVYALEDLQNLTIDRQMRKALSALQERYPILASSGDGGYYFAGSSNEVAEYAGEINSRAMNLLQKSRRLAKLAEEYFGPQQQKLL